MPKSCSKCKKEFQPGESVLNALSKPWHVSCFVCGSCNKPFSGGSCVLEGGVPMHEDCAKKQFEKDSGGCDVCHKTLGNGEPIVELGDGGKYHQSCFVCAKCKKPFDKKMPYHVKVEGNPYHPKCAEVDKSATETVIQNNKTCTNCGKTIKAGVRVVPDLGSFHPECFVCDTCNSELDGSYYVHPKTEKASCKPCIDKFTAKWNSMDEK
jgi:hypothetical protein